MLNGSGGSIVQTQPKGFAATRQHGAICDVIVDLRRSSTTYLKWQAFELTCDKPVSLYVPKGFAHGFQTLTDNAQASYQISVPYAPDAGAGFRHDDPAFAIEWPLPVSMWMAFSAGADFYFCDTNRPDSDRAAFAINGFPRGTIEPLSHDDGIFWYRDSLLRLNLTDAPFGTNCIGYRLAGQESIRFSTEFTRSCEDRFFIAELSRHARQTAFSVHRDVELGVGVNIFASSVWGTAAGLVRMLDTTRFHVRLGREFVLDRDEQQLNGRCLRA